MSHKLARHFLFALGAALLLRGCTTPANTAITSGACSDRTYSNATYQFGFNPPSSFVGPTFSTTSVYSALPVLTQAFVSPLVSTQRIDMQVIAYSSDLNAWIAAIKAQRLLGGNALITDETFTTDGGVAATLLVWSSTNGVIYEVFSQSGSDIIALHTTFSLIESGLVDATIRSSFHSLCVVAPAAP